jgi:hypothetical protein
MLPENLEVVQVTTEQERLTTIICAPLFVGPSTQEASEEQSAFECISQMCNEVSREIKNQIAKLTSDKPQLNSGVSLNNDNGYVKSFLYTMAAA